MPAAIVPQLLVSRLSSYAAFLPTPTVYLGMKEKAATIEQKGNLPRNSKSRGIRHERQSIASHTNFFVKNIQYPKKLRIILIYDSLYWCPMACNVTLATDRDVGHKQNDTRVMNVACHYFSTLRCIHDFGLATGFAAHP